MEELARDAGAERVRMSVTSAAPESDIERRYREGDPALTLRLGGSSSDLVNFSRAADAAANSRIDRRALVAALHRINESFACGDATRAAIDRLADPRTLVVATGQQPGFLTGPLYTVLKAASAVALARTLTERLSRPCIPVFWIASDDHDLPEIEGCHLLTDRAEVRRFRVPLGADPVPSARLAVPESATGVFDEYLAALGDDASRDRVREIAAPRTGDRWPAWFGRILTRLFESSGLVLFEPHQAPEVWQSRLFDVLRDPTPARDALRAGAEHLGSLGLPAPLPVDSASNVFVLDGARRRRFDPASDDAGAWVARAERDPGSITGDAGLRAALQSLVFPTVAVVGGAGELSYWMQLPELFAAVHAPRPLFVPRISATFVETRVRRAIEGLAATDADLFVGEARLRERFAAAAEAAMDPAVTARADAAVAAFDAFAASLGTASESVAKRIAELRTTYSTSLAKLIDAAARARQERAGSTERRMLLIARAGRPHDQPQDRVLNGLAFAGRSGVDLYDRFAARLDPLDFRHRVVHPDLAET